MDRNKELEEMSRSIICVSAGLGRDLALLALDEPLNPIEKEVLISHIQEAQEHLHAYEKLQSDVLGLADSVGK